MLKVNIDEIGGGLRLKETLAATALPELKAMQDAGELKFETPVTFELDLKRLESVVIIEGRLNVAVSLNCGRCLNDYVQTVAGDFTLKAVPQPSATPNRAKETELLDDDMDDLYYNGNVLDLREVLQEQVILALPIAPVCKADCKGLCLNCGHDLNLGQCGCDTQQGHIAFAGLKDLL